MARLIVNHKGGVGEIGKICNHSVIQTGTIGNIINHHMENAAPRPESIINESFPNVDEKQLAKILGVWLYPGRVLASTLPKDIIQLHPDLKCGWNWIIQHLDRVGISHTKNVIWDDDFSIVKEFSSYKLSTFFFGDLANGVRPNNERFRITDLMNQKNEFLKLAEKIGLPIPRTVFFDSKSEVQDCEDFEYPCVLKISESVSGLGVAICKCKEDLEKELSALAEGVAFQIQEYLEGACYPSVQYGIINDRVERITETSNILEGSIHAGNWGRKDFSLGVASITDPMAFELKRLGMQGWFSFDLAFHNKRCLIIECNPRYTGAAYPYNAAKKLEAGFWIHKNYHTNINSLEQLDLGELEFGANNHKKSGNNREGWILINWGPLAAGEGKGGFLYIGKPENFSKWEDGLKKIL